MNVELKASAKGPVSQLAITESDADMVDRYLGPETEANGKAKYGFMKQLKRMLILLAWLILDVRLLPAMINSCKGLFQQMLTQARHLFDLLPICSAEVGPGNECATGIGFPTGIQGCTKWSVYVLTRTT
ncbi:hypothetical protein HPP92_006934 [Vanilla planifolia]|uniref:Uncharacterized protein n=1 Tax=Vanilla planifolia TaxID=51239 RepID=A0A835V7J7_VANPL|nr:hypothetical protein HPP92_007173 [Vanilla planifolia]KAG0490071.1 hypothetical protein HPP92_006934 [Vanilla planifolia]